MTMNESLLNDIRATINWAVQSQTNIGAAYSVLETLVKDIEKSLLDEDNDHEFENGTEITVPFD